MTAEELLQDLETQTHAARVRAMIALGRRGDDESRAILAQLAQGGFYERSLALYACFGSRDAAHVLRALGDPSRILRGLATRLAALVCEDADLLQALASLPREVSVALLWKLCRQRRHAVIDAFLERPETIADARFCALLPLGSPALIARLAAPFIERAEMPDWMRLAREHPATTTDMLQRQLDASSEPDARLLARINALLPLLAPAEPERALALVRALQRTTPLDEIRFVSLAERLPGAVADLLLAEPADRGATLSPNLSKQTLKLTPEQIIALYKRYPRVFGWNESSWFPQLPPASREAVFAAIAPRLRRNGATVPAAVVAALPRAAHEREAQRLIGQTRLRERLRLTYAACLPWDEMRAAVEPYLHSSEATVRQAALAALIGAVAYHRERLGETLALLQERRTEQDGTRRVMLSALHALPAAVWRAEHLPDLAEVLRHGLNDVGLSPGTQQQMVALLLKVSAVHTDWSAMQLTTVLRERGWTSPSRSSAPLPPTAEQRLAEDLLPLLESWMARDDEAAVLGAIETLLVRPTVFAPALPLLEELLRRTRTRAHAEDALALIAARAHPRLAALLPALLAEDASWITFSTVSDLLLRRRQDLLAPFLSYQPYAGRWSTDRRPFLPPLTVSFTCGTARQQARLADAALGIIADETQDARTTTQAVKLLALVPGIAAERVVPLAADARTLVRTTALFMLARLDTDAGFSTLLGALQDARARIAIHALTGFLLAMPADQALGILRTVPLDRVTVAKEVVRLVGALAPAAAYDELLALERRDLHRDVRIALLRTLGRYLDRAETWTILEQAARTPERAVAVAPLAVLRPFVVSRLTGRQLAALPARTVERQALRLVAALLEHPDPLARAAALRYCARLDVSDDEHVVVPLLAARLPALAAPGAAKEAVEQAEALVDAICGVCAADDGPTIAQMVRVLLPNRRLLALGVQSLHAEPRLREPEFLPIIQAALAALADDPLTVHLRIELLDKQAPWEELAALFRELSRENALHADALSEASGQLARDYTRFAPAELEAFETSLAASEDERLRRLAFAVLQARATKAGHWNAALRTRLQAYRDDPAALVAAAAQFTFPGEDDGDDEDWDDDDDDWDDADEDWDDV